MSSTPPKDSDRQERRERRENRAPKENVHTPANERLARFLQDEFAENPPQRVEVVRLGGSEALRRGHTVKTKDYRPNQKLKPEEIVELGNSLIVLAQTHCDGVGKPGRYGILIWDDTADAKARAVFVLNLHHNPIDRSKEQGGTVGDPRGSLDFDDEDDDYDERRSGPRVFTDRFKVFAKNEYRFTQLNLTSIGDVMEVMKEGWQSALATIEKLTDTNSRMSAQLEEARSHAHQREMDLEWTKLKVESVRDGKRMLLGAVPLAISRLTSSSTIPSGKTPESMAIEEFLNGLKDDQISALFGDCDDSGKQTKEGIFTVAQLKILTGIAKCELRPDAMNELFEGPHAIGQDQLARAQSVLTDGQAMTFGPFIMDQHKRFLERKANAQSATG